MLGIYATEAQGDLRTQQKTGGGRPRPFVSPVLLLMRRLIEDAVFVASSEPIESIERRSTRGVEATREAREWIVARTPEKSDLWLGSFEFACTWLSVWGVRNLMEPTNRGGHLPGQYELHARMQKIPESGFVEAARTILLEFIDAQIAAREQRASERATMPADAAVALPMTEAPVEFLAAYP